MALFSLAIPTEGSREGTTFATMPTPDAIKEVVVGEKGLVRIGYSARFKSSVSGVGRAAIFIGANQLRSYTTESKVQQCATNGTAFRQLTTAPAGLLTSTSGTATGADMTTGQAISASLEGGMVSLWVAAGTYEVSVRFLASEGAVNVKERRLWVEVPE